ncbi:MAG: UDP-glucose/GDP-mannose dehydrogenase family protein [Nanoarchaeota archaeon]|nr:UDP-glucose/GDP-mannose dehydrogenase family protein [Nanoarchaeota archaeon]
MKVTVVGTGYVGLVLGTCLAEMGNDVICADVDKDKVKTLNSGTPTIYEPGLKELLERNLAENRITFTTDIGQGIIKSEIIFIAVGTPPDKENKADLKYVKQVAEQIGKNMDTYKVVVNKSTVPVGTADLVKQIIKDNQKSPIPFDVVSNPEFLREGKAIKDFMAPDRVVIGADSEKAREAMLSLYKGLERTDHPILTTGIKTAEIIKYASNAMLATRISFINQLAPLCEKVGADVKMVAKGMGLDNRIGHKFLQAGIGYGGSCFPKDIKALIQTLKEYSCNHQLLDAVEDINHDQRHDLIEKIKSTLGDINSKTIAVWGLSFKPDTDDIREAPAMEIIKKLLDAGAKVKAFDPVAEKEAKKELPEVEYCKTPYAAAQKADLLLIATEWNEFRNLDMEKVKQSMNSPNLIDGRNIYEPEKMRNLGYTYKGIGR